MAGALCDTTNIPKSPALQKKSISVGRTYKRTSSTIKKGAVAALATTLQKAAELETIHAKASITPTRQKRKRDNLRALDTDNEVKMLQEYFKEVDQCVLEEEVKMHSTPRKDASITRQAWLTPEEPRGKVRRRTPDTPQQHQQQKENTTPEPKRKHSTSTLVSDIQIREPASSPNKETQPDGTPKKDTPAANSAPPNGVFATPEPKPRATRKRAAQVSQEHASPALKITPVKTQAQAQRTYAGKLRRVR